MLKAIKFVFHVILLVAINSMMTKADSCNDYITKCTGCTQKQILCNSIEVKDLQDTFINISVIADENQKHFTKLVVDNYNADLTSDIFRDVTFDEISISGYSNLMNIIDPDAFTGTNMVTKSIKLSTMPYLTTPASSIFQALSSFVNLQTLNIKNCNITEIPSNAFQSVQGKQFNLTQIIFYGDNSKQYQKIGSNAFSQLAHLSEIVFTNTKIDYIPAYAFSFDQASSNQLTITFNNSIHNQDIGFNELSFVNIQRPTVLTIEHAYSILDEKVFLPFLLQNNLNKLNIKFNNLNCDDCKNYWILKNNLDHRLSNIKCSNQRAFDNHKNFKGCTTKIGQAIKPCVHDNETLICGGYEDMNIKEKFDSLSKLKFEQKHFQRLILNNTAITSLSDNTFSDITFDEIYVKDCHSLKNIGTNAFNGTDQDTHTLIIENNRYLTSPTNTIWQTIDNFTKLQKLHLNYNNITEIPSQAFKNNHTIKEIELLGDSFEKLGSKAFSPLMYLGSLSFESAKFNKIPDYAFYFENVIMFHEFHLTLSHLPNINSNGFEENSLDSIGMATLIDFYPANEMEVLSRKVFEPFLMKSEKNRIDFHSNRIDCSNCKNFWVKNNTVIQSRQLNVLCTNGKSINDPDNFRC